jgi:pectinesterase
MYRTLAEALAVAPSETGKPFRILVPAGVWREHNAVTKQNVHLIGEGSAASVIVYDDNAQAQRPEGVPGSTLVIEAPGFQAAHLTIANDFDYPAHLPAEAPYDRTGASGSQARALQRREQRSLTNQCSQ